MLYYQKNGADLPLDWEDYAIQEELFGAEDTLTFTLPPEHPQLHDMTPLLELTDKDSGQRYLITAMDEGDVTARLDADALKTTLWPVYSNHSDTPAGTVSGALPAGWLCIDHTARTDKKTLALEGVTPLDVLRETADKFGIGIRIGTESRKVELFDRTADTAIGAYFTEELNLLQRPVRSAKAEGFATRLYAYGKDGMTFADVNDGKANVEDHSWSDRVICAYWKDERYTVKENLLADAKAKLAAMAVPAVSYECSVADLARIDPQRWGQLSVPLYSAVILMDRARGTRTVHHVARIKRWPHHPEKNVVTLSTVPGTLRGKVEQTWNAVSDHNSDFRQLQQAAVDSATAQITGNKGGYVVLHSSTGGREPDEVLIMDTPDIATATRVWRWNKAGLGYSSTGYNGPYGLAMTQDGAIVADFITAGTLKAIDIEGVTIKGSEFFSLGAIGEWLRMQNGIISGGMVVDGAEKEWGRIDYDYRYGADRALTHNAPHRALLANDLLTGSYNADASSVTAYKGQTRGITLLQSANYEKYEFDCITDFSVDGNNITWTTAHISIPYVSGFNYYTTQYVNGIMVTQ